MSWMQADRIARKFVPSTARLSYNPFLNLIGDFIANILGSPFSEWRDLPPNHLRVRVGVGNKLINNHAFFAAIGANHWVHWLSRSYCNFKSDIVEIGCGCGRIARTLNEPWFEGTFVGVDIDPEMIEWCRAYFSPGRFRFVLSPHRSKTYSNGVDACSNNQQLRFAIDEPNSKDFVYSTSLLTHLLEQELTYYIDTAYELLRPRGTMLMTFFCPEHLVLGDRWTFKHRIGNAFVENQVYPEAAVGYSEDYIRSITRAAGFSQVEVEKHWPQSWLIAHK